MFEDKENNNGNGEDDLNPEGDQSSGTDSENVPEENVSPNNDPEPGSADVDVKED